MSPLDNPIWQSLITTHAHFAETCNSARKFRREVSVLAGFSEPTPENYDSLAAMMRPEEQVGLFLQAPADPPSSWTIARTRPLLQMLCENRSPLRVKQPEFIRLTEADAPEMLALTKLTNPGPFGARTHELGDYLGIRVGGTLAAMAGERLRLPGYTEISAVCTHPDHLGHGYASALMGLLMDRICSRGERPILHVLPENTRAIQVYERLGFAKRAMLQLAVLRHGAEPNLLES
ncbi:MAG TPA: GNAT family N-acetyltransferase [Terriglobales bacterium]|nr:GNAT family N-acetyltransferase [Terriglobales bacterium]